MKADRTEKLKITRTHKSTVVKCTIIEDGIEVSYSVQTFESQIADGVRTAKAGADRLLFKSK